MNNKATLEYYLALKRASCHLPKYGWTWTLCRVKLDSTKKMTLHNRRRKNDSEVLLKESRVKVKGCEDMHTKEPESRVPMRRELIWCIRDFH